MSKCMYNRGVLEVCYVPHGELESHFSSRLLKKYAALSFEKKKMERRKGAKSLTISLVSRHVPFTSSYK